MLVRIEIDVEANTPEEAASWGWDMLSNPAHQPLLPVCDVFWEENSRPMERQVDLQAMSERQEQAEEAREAAEEGNPQAIQEGEQ